MRVTPCFHHERVVPSSNSGSRPASIANMKERIMARLHPVLTTALTGAIALTVSACSKPDEGKTPFAPPADQAREIFWTQVVDTNVKVAAMGMDDTTSQTTKMNLLATPSEADDAGMRSVDTTFDYFDMSMSGAQNPALGGVDVNAANKAVAKGLMGKSISANVDVGGNVISISGADAVAESVLAEMSTLEYPEEMGDVIKKLAEESTLQQFGEDAMKNLAETFIVPRSLEKLSPGTTWTRSGKADFGMMPTDVTYTYTVSERTDTAVIIGMASTFELDPSGTNMVEMIKQNPMVAQLGEPTLTLSGTGTGTYTIDSASGWAQVYDGTNTLTGKLAIGPMNADIDITIAEDFTSNFK